MKELFVLKGNPQLNKDSFVFSENAPYPYFTRSVLNNGILGYVEYLDKEHKISGNCLAVGMMGMQFFYMSTDFYAGQFTKSVFPKKDKLPKFNKRIAQYFTTLLNKFQAIYQGGLVRHFEGLFNSTELVLPFNKLDNVAINYIEDYIKSIEMLRLEKLKLYLINSNLFSIDFTQSENLALQRLSQSPNNSNIKWQEYNLQDLFGSATRGQRLKKSDRIEGDLPFITAGEANTGVSGFIGNSVHRFKANTTTIDMFGSAKYRNYDYGGDDHVAVVHTEELPTFASIFVTSAIHKASYNGQFDYGRNFYAKDANTLNISLPAKDDGTPDYDYMNTLMSAIHKKVIKGVVEYVEKSLETDS